jgi:CubicO group peptidase (beta-lactamase class C family)
MEMSNSMTEVSRNPFTPSRRGPVAGRAVFFRPAAAVVAALLMLAFSPAAGAGHAPPDELAGIEEVIERGMRDWGIPGLAVAVVKDDELVWARGFGVRRLGEDGPVDADTLFNVASVTKAFTAAALGILVDEERLDWDDPVVRHLPRFRLYDPYVTQTATIRDLLAHRVGVGRMTGNRLKWISSRSRAEQMERIRHLGPDQTFRNGHVYSNVMYMVAGEVIPSVTGSSWEDFVRERIFAPLGMSRSTTSVTQLRPGDNVAYPHQEIDGRVVEIPRRNFDAVGAAASIHTSASEIAAWMRLHLGEPGVLEGRRLLNDATVKEMHRAQSISRTPAFTSLAAYGLGWNLGDYAGHPVSRHSGAVDGINTHLVLMPDQQLGIFVVANLHTDLIRAVANQIVDVYLDLPRRDWHEIIFGEYEERRARVQAERDAIHDLRRTNTRPTLPLDRFAGRYEDALYADAEVWLEEGRLVLRLWGDEEMVADLDHWHYDTFRAVWRNRAQREEFLWFTRGADGAVAALHIDWNLRPALIQVGAYPSAQRRVATFDRVPEPVSEGNAPGGSDTLSGR